MIRVFIVDDHQLMRTGLRLLLAAQPDLAIVGEAGNGHELLAQLPTTPADVVLLDVHMPGLNGPETTRQLRQLHPDALVLALSMLDKESYVQQMLDVGARGYLFKGAGTQEIAAGIRAVAAGEQYFGTAGPAVERELMEDFGPPRRALAPTGRSLSRREREVLQLIAEGLTTGEIADKLFTSKRTIETHRQNILEKMQAKNTAALIRLAMGEGLIS